MTITWDDVEEGGMFWVDALNPLGTFKFAADPSWSGLQDYFVKKAALTGVLGTSAALLHLASSPHARTPVSILARNFYWVQQGMMKEAKRTILKGAVRAGASAAPVLIGAAVVAGAGAGAYAYEKSVNEPIRESHPGSQGTWFGPFGSGFGSVV